MKCWRVWLIATYPIWSAVLWANRRVQVLPSSVFGRVLGWHTLGRSLWHRGEFDQAYRWEHLGEPLTEMPRSVILGGIRHSVQVSDGLIVFSQERGFYGHHSRIAFERGSDGMLWYMSFDETWGKVPMAHVSKAFQYVQAVYGGDHELRKEAR